MHPNQSDSPPQENTQGRHYTPKSPSLTTQPLDPTRITPSEIAKTIPQLRKLG
jgi:hypothetical protein